MKKTILLLLVLSVFSFNGIAQENATFKGLKTLNDSLNYTLGFANGDAIKKYYTKLPIEQLIPILIKNLEVGFHSTNIAIAGKDSTIENSEIRDMGLKVGTTLKNQLVTGLLDKPELKVDFELIKGGLLDGLRGNERVMKLQEVMEYLQKTIKNIENKQTTSKNK
jgi:hypothetical protein